MPSDLSDRRPAQSFGAFDGATAASTSSSPSVGKAMISNSAISAACSTPLHKTVAEKYAFLVDHFADIAVTLVEENSVAGIKRTFIQRVADGEIKVSATAS